MPRSTHFLFLCGCLLLALVWFVSLAPQANAQTPSTGFQATYYDGRALEGTPILTRLEPVINWSYDIGGSPMPGTIPSTDFSVRWEGWYQMDRAGAWTFTYTSDDGARVWIDNQLAIDLWYDHGPLTRFKTLELASGYHLLRIEYYQRDGGMTSQLSITPPGVFSDWMGEYFANPYVIGEPRYRVNDTAINFNWGNGSPDPRLPADNFSVRWTRLYNFAPGTYTFSATADDGIRVWVGDTLAIDAWVPQQAKTYTAALFLNGTLPLRVEYFEQGGDALANFTFTTGDQQPSSSVSTETWSSTYFNNPDLTAPPACQQAAAQLSFKWGTASPGCGLGSQAYSIRWESGRSTPATGFYTVHLTVDDGARLFIDDAKILDAWREQAPTTYSATVYLTAGLHTWRVEYFQGAGSAQLNLEIAPGVSAPTLPLPPPSSDLIVNASGPGWTQFGDPTVWQTTPDGNGGGALWMPNDVFLQPSYNWGRWYPSLIQARNYQISVYIPANIATTTNARYWIFHAGHYDSVVISQSAYSDQWVSLGTYAFTGEGGEFVSLSAVTYECNACTKIVWDAVKFSPI